MPATWAEYGNGGDRFDPYDSIEATGRFLADLQDMIADVASNDVEQIEFTLAAYNAGPGAVQQYNGIPPYPETQNYVQIIIGNADVDYSEDCTERAGSVVGDLGTGEWTHPLPGGRSTSDFGPRPCPAGAACNEYTTNHHGLDFSTGGGTEIIAPTDIEVTATGTNQFQGEYVVGRMTDGAELVFQFHHCQSGSTSVSVGDTSVLETPSLSAPAYVLKATPATHLVLTFISKSTCQKPTTANQPTTTPPIQLQSSKSKVFYEPENSYQFPSRRHHRSSSWTDLPARLR